MAIVLKKKKEIPLPPKGQHVARCDMIVDLGLQPSQNPKFADKRQVYLRWCLPKERVEWETDDGEKKEGPKTAAMFYNLTFGRGSNLLALMQAWEERDIKDGDEVDLAEKLGAACSIYIKHEKNTKGDMRAKVVDVSPLEVSAVPPLEHEALLYDSDNQESYDKLPKGIQALIDRQITEEAEEGDEPPF